MKKILFYALAATTLALTSCKKNVLEPPSAADNAIHIVASIASQARAPQLANDGSGSFSQGDKMAQLQISVAYFCSIGLYFLV